MPQVCIDHRVSAARRSTKLAQVSRQLPRAADAGAGRRRERHGFEVLRRGLVVIELGRGGGRTLEGVVRRHVIDGFAVDEDLAAIANSIEIGTAVSDHGGGLRVSCRNPTPSPMTLCVRKAVRDFGFQPPIFGIGSRYKQAYFLSEIESTQRRCALKSDARSAPRINQRCFAGSNASSRVAGTAISQLSRPPPPIH